MIKVKSFEKKAIKFLFYYTLIIQGLMSLLGLPQIFLYVKDIVLIIGVLFLLYSRSVTYKKREVVPISIICIPALLLMFCIISGIINEISAIQILIAIRKMFRGFVFMYLCVEYLSFSDFEKMIHLAYKLQIINLVIIICQKIFLDLGQDYSNGIFGTGLTNNYNSVLCLILVCYCTVEYFSEKCTLKYWIFQLVLNFLIAAIIELKVLFVLIPIGVILILREKLFSGRGLKISLFLCVVVLCALIVFGTMYAEQLNVLTSLSGFSNYNNWGLATHAIVDRKNWLQYTVNNVFEDNLLNQLLGMGFGIVSGNHSGALANTYYSSLGYGGYCASTIFMETGIIGLGLTFLWFLCLWRNSFKTSGSKIVKDMKRFLQGFVVLMIIFLVYSNFMFNDSTFLAFLVFSFPFIVIKEEQYSKNYHGNEIGLYEDVKLHYSMR